ncbi:MAG: GNAT family N-acetyltransferase [Caldisericia bacterium]|nr:GNAT family N-acetyltransferase [Caldisericia bacterium]
MKPNLKLNLKPLDLNKYKQRLIKHEDYQDVCQISKDIWDGGDYLPKVFHEWVDSPGLFVGIEDTIKKQIVAVGKYSYLPDKTGLIEGLRVHSEYRGEGLSWQVDLPIFNKALEDKKNGTVDRIANCTHILNKVSLHMSKKVGFREYQKYLCLELNSEEIDCKQVSIENWEPTYEEILMQPYFKNTNNHIAQNFLVQRMTKDLFKELKKRAHFALVDGYPGFLDNNHGNYCVSLVPTAVAQYKWLKYSAQKLNSHNVLSFVYPDKSVINELKTLPVRTWVDFEPDLVYLVF